MNDKEKQFIRYWEASRNREKSLGYQLLFGIPIGLLFSLPIIVIALTGKYWYVRADIAARSMTSPYLLVVAVFIIAIFVAIFYKRYQWEKKEQLYQELKAREKAEMKPDHGVQQ